MEGEDVLTGLVLLCADERNAGEEHKNEYVSHVVGSPYSPYSLWCCVLVA